MSSESVLGAGMALVASACIVVLTGCAGLTQVSTGLVDGSGEVRTETRSVDDFTKVEIHHGIDLRLAIGSPQRVLVTAQDNLLAMTTTIVSDGRLVVEAEQDFYSADGITATVTMPSITELVLHDGATGRADGLDEATLAVHVDHGASLTMTGSADWLGLSSHGGCVIDLGGFVVGDATVELAQDVVVRLDVTDCITGSATDGVSVTLSGRPRIVDVVTSGGATVVSP